VSAGAPREPRLFELLLRLLVRGEGSEFVLGDVSEDFRRIALRAGPAAARRWYRAQAVRTALGWIARAPRRPAEAYVRDARLALRSLRLSPTYTLGTVVTLAVGIGGAASVAAVGATVLRPLPFPESERLVAVWETREGRQRSVSPANYLDWRRTASSFEGLAAHDVRTVSVTVGGVAARDVVALVSGNFFDVLRGDPLLGRSFDPELDTDFGQRVAVLSHAAWTDAFGAARDVIGRSFLVDDASYEVVGVMPDGFDAPEADVFAWLRSRTEAPEIAGFGADLPSLRDSWYFEVVGRLADGVTIEAAAAEMAGIARRLEEAYPVANRRAGVRLVPLLDQAVAGFESLLLALALAVLLVLVAAGANVAHLALARGAARERAVAVKRALGATRADVRRSALIEGVALGLGGASVGLSMAAVLMGSPLLTRGGWVPRAGEVALRPSVVGFALLLGVVVGVAVGLAGDVRSAIRGGRGVARGEGGTRTRGSRAMIAGQVAVAVALLVGTTLMARSLVALGSVDLGFRTDGLATVRIAMPDARTRAYEERILGYRAIMREIRSIPGVESAGMGSASPLSQGMRAGVFVAGEAREGDPPDSGWQPVDPEYLPALGVTLVEGRLFAESEDATSPDVAVVNRAFVRSVLADGEAIGARVTMGLDGHDRPLTIVGVVGDTRTRGPGAPPGPVLYRPMAQTLRFGADAVFVAARVSGNEDRAIAAIRDAVRATAPGMPVYDEAAGRDLARPFEATQSALLAILGVFTTTALLLGGVGVYAVAAYGVRRRRREIGVRLALGADARRVSRDVLFEGLRDALTGVPLGVLLALLLGRALRSALFGVGGADPWSVALSIGAVLVVSAVALLVPGRIAARTDPAGAMRDG